MISHVMTLANGIIGVSVLAMPYCFKQCGIVLATLVLLLSSLLSRLACHFLIKSAVMSRRRNFEFLAFHAFGPMGKFLAELCIIGFLLGTCIAFFVVVGDLGPQIIGEMFDKNPENIRTSLLITAGIFIVLPLGLLRNIDSLSSVSTASIAFYICLALKVAAESTHHIFAGDWFDKVHYWQMGGMLQCLPIFALALFCQTQLFEIYETMPNASLEKMNEVVEKALNICTIVYISVGIFGNIAFCNQPFTGNILMSFEPSMSSEVIKIGFVLSVVFSFPLVIFPCRASLNSLLFKQGYVHEISSSYITETRFRCLTTFIVTMSLIVGVLIPNIEFVLGIVGSTIGVLICLIFPAAFFVSISTKNTNERLLAQFIVIIGIWIMILGTYANLYAMEKSSNSRGSISIQISNQIDSIPPELVNHKVPAEIDTLKKSDFSFNTQDISEKPKLKVPDKVDVYENIRKEPPVPVELVKPEKLKGNQKNIADEKAKIDSKIKESVERLQDTDQQIIQETYDSLKKLKKTSNELQEQKIDSLHKENNKIDSGQKNNDVIAVDAIKKEDLELEADKEISNAESMQRREQLDKTLEKHIMQEKDLMEEQKQLLKDIEEKKKEIELAKKTESNQDNLKTKLKSSNMKIIDQDPMNSKVHDSAQNNQKSGEEEKKNPLMNGNEKILVDAQNSENLIFNNKNQPPSNHNLKINKIKRKEEIYENEVNFKNNNLELLDKKPNNSIMSTVLTKKSNLSFNENKIVDEVEKNKKNTNGNEIKNDLESGLRKNLSAPIVLKMKNQTKVSDLEHVKKQESGANLTGIKKNVLEKHQRLKREESQVPDNILDKVDKRERVNLEGEVCDKKSEKRVTTNTDKLNSAYFIKESERLSDQDIEKKVSQDSIVPEGDHFINLKNET